MLKPAGVTNHPRGPSVVGHEVVVSAVHMAVNPEVCARQQSIIGIAEAGAAGLFVSVLAEPVT